MPKIMPKFDAENEFKSAILAAIWIHGGCRREVRRDKPSGAGRILASPIWQRHDTGRCRRIVVAGRPPTPLDAGRWSKPFESKKLAETDDTGA